MSKVSFRARALDVYKPMPIYRYEEIPDLRDFDKINRAVVQMPTGMEKEEETETHLQKALTAQQFYGTAEARVIPIPDVRKVDERYDKLYRPDYKTTKQYIHIQALGMEQEIPDYDLDSEDESWLQEQNKKMEITSIKFEEMMDRLEKGSGQQVVTLQEAKLLLKEDDDLIIAVYDYWLNKRLRLEMPLICQVKSEKRDGTTTNNPYVAFRRRTEKMQTRKNRKNDEVSYERMLKLRRDMVKASTLTEFLKRREKSKKEILQLTIEVMEKRYQMEDFSGTMLAEAEAERAKMPLFVPPYMFNSRGQAVPTFNGEEVPVVRKKRPYRRRQKPPQPTHHPHAAAAAAMATAASFGDVDILHHDLDSSEEDFMSPAMSPSDHEDENDPDGPFAFKRRKLCSYYAPLYDRLGNWPWCDPEQGGKGDKRHRYSLTSLPRGRCVGYARRRVGRGGRVILDRGFTPWDDGLEKLNLSSGQSYSGQLGDYVTYIREKKIPHYRPQTPPSEDDSLRDEDRSTHPSAFPSKSSSPDGQEFNVESFNCHRQQLLAMHRQQEASLFSQDLTTGAHNSLNGHRSDLRRSFCSQPTSRFTLDSASAQFAVSAVVDSALLDSAHVKQGAGIPVSIAGDSAGVAAATAATTVSTSVSSSGSATMTISTPVVLPSLAKSVSVTSIPSCVQSQQPVLTSSSTLSTSSLLSLSSQTSRPLHLHPTGLRVTPNGPIISSSSMPTSSLITNKTTGLSPSTSVLQLPLSITSATVLRAMVPGPTPAVAPSPSPTPSVPTPSPIPVCAASALAAGKMVTGGNRVVSAGMGAPSGMCNRPNTSPINILKSSHEESANSVHIFTTDTPMAMDVS